MPLLHPPHPRREPDSGIHPVHRPRLLARQHKADGGEGDEVRLDEFIEQALTRIVGLDMVTEQGHVFYLDSVARTDLDPQGREAEDVGEGKGEGDGKRRRRSNKPSSSSSQPTPSSSVNDNNAHNLRSSTFKPPSSSSSSMSKRKRPSSSSAATPADNRFQGNLSDDEEGDLLASPTKRSRGTDLVSSAAGRTRAGTPLRSSVGPPSSSVSAGKRKKVDESSELTSEEDEVEVDVEQLPMEVEVVVEVGDDRPSVAASGAGGGGGGKSKKTRRKRAKRGSSRGGKGMGKERETETEHGDGSDEEEE
jgi:hypothetical protein